MDEPLTLMIGGRNLAPDGRPPNSPRRSRERTSKTSLLPPGFFLRIIAVTRLIGKGGYAELTVQSDSQQVAIEQSDAQPAGAGRLWVWRRLERAGIQPDDGRVVALVD